MMFLNKRGFTLLELMIVVIVIGILASIAIPQYVHTIERARGAEALVNLGSIRGSMQRYWIDQLARIGRGSYMGASLAAGLNQLDIDDPNDGTAWRYFDYSLISSDATHFIATATRLSKKTPKGTFPGPIVANATVRIDQDGDILYGSAW